MLNPAAWAQRVAAAMTAAEGYADVAAQALGVSSRQLHRWLDDPLLAHVPRAPNGRCRSYANAGRPKGSKNKPKTTET